jgi:hypothetical protein
MEMEIKHSFLGARQTMPAARTRRGATARFNNNLLAHQMVLAGRCLPTGTPLGAAPDVSVYSTGSRRAMLADVFQRSTKVVIVR